MCFSLCPVLFRAFYLGTAKFTAGRMEKYHKSLNEDVLKHILFKNYNIKLFNFNVLDAFENLNLHVISHDADSAEEFVVKISEFGSLKNKNINLEFQFEMMAYLNERGIQTTQSVPTVTGQLTCEHSIDTQDKDRPAKLHVFMLYYVPGMTLRAAGNPMSLMEDVGRLAGQLDAALKTFVPTGKPDPRKGISWAIPDASLIENRLGDFCDTQVLAMGLEMLCLYRQSVLPVLNTFQKGYIHGDLHDCNIIVKETPSIAGLEKYSTSGVIDFEDAEESYYVFEATILIADLMSASLGHSEPLHVASQTLTGYRQEMELSETELSALRVCLCVRLLHYYVLSGDSLEHDPGNAYVGLDRDNYMKVFKKLYTVTDEEFTARVIGR